MQELFDVLTTKQFVGNELWRFVVLLGAILAGLVVGRILRYMLESASKRARADEKTLLLSLCLECLGRPLAFACFTGGLSLGLAFLNMSARLTAISWTTLNVLLAVVVGYAIYRLVDILDYYLARWAGKTETKLDDMLVPLVRKSVRIAVVVVVAMFILDQIVEDITTLLAGLGVGGLAVALAAQDTIKNFFGSLMILLDKPFQVGDRIVIGGHDGPVVEVGFRSTKIRTLEGHLVTVPNSLIANEKVQNIGKRPYIRRLMNVTITYDTPPEKVLRAVEILRELLDDHEGMDPEFPPRVYFNDFNADSLNIIVIYWNHPPNYWDFLAFNQKINMQIFERFNGEGIEFAFPTQTLYLANDDKRQLAVRVLGKDLEHEAT